MSRLIVTTKHLFTLPGFHTRPGMCRGKSKDWARARGIDWSDFVRNGIEADILTATGDAFALALVEWARTCKDANGNG